MSWLVSTIANSLRLDDDEEIPKEGNKPSAQPEQSLSPPVKPVDDQNPSSGTPPSDHQISSPRGVKEDLSEFSKTLSRQFWGVASFLAPPPDSEISDPNNQQPSNDSDPDSLSTVGIAGIRSDLSEIGGRFRTGISKLSTHKTVSEFTKIATNLLQFESEEGEFSPQGAIGVTEEVVAFAKDVSMHPETWIDFPLPDEDEDQDEEFELSDAQQEHALAVENLAPRLAALRLELCPGYMSDGSFWKIYFVLVHPRLAKEDAVLLSTPQIMMARAMLTSELQRRSKTTANVLGAKKVSSNSAHEVHLSVPSNDSSESVPANVPSSEPPTSMKTSESILTNVPSAELPASMKASETNLTNVPSAEPPTSMKASESIPTNVPSVEPHKARNIEVDQHSLESLEDAVVDKAVVEEEISVHNEINEKATGPSASKTPCIEEKQHDRFQYKEEEDDEEGDDWLKEDAEEISITGRNDTAGAFEDEDVSFSDLEDDDDGEIPIKYNKSAKKVQTETKDSNDWLDVDDIDVA